jgi:predicted HD phosphohydrolase
LDAEELASFEAEAQWPAAVRLRRWDDAAKDPAKKTLTIEDFSPYLEAALARATT